MSCDCDVETASSYDCAMRTATGPLVCCECGGAIAPGETYEHVVGVWPAVSDAAETLHTCTACIDIRRWVAGNLPCFCWAHETMLDDAHEAVAAAARRAPDETAGLRFGLLRRIVAAQRAREGRGA